jgi:hypothetical protein
MVLFYVDSKRIIPLCIKNEFAGKKLCYIDEVSRYKQPITTCVSNVMTVEFVV